MRAMKKEAKKIDVQIVPAGSTATVAVLPDAVSVARAIACDHALFESTSRLAGFIALRIGLRLVWLRDSEPYGSLKNFIKAHLKEHSERTLFNYIHLAQGFIDAAKLRDRKTQRLRDGEAIREITTCQLELFNDPKARHEGALKKAFAWLDDRGLTQIYRDLAAEHIEKNPPHGPKRKKGEAERIKQARADALNSAQDLVSFRELKKWQYLDEGEIALLVKAIKKFEAEIAEFCKQARAARPREWKGGEA